MKLLLLILTVTLSLFASSINFENKEIVSFVNENFVSVIMDINEDEKILPYKFIGIPTFYFSDASNMKLLAQRIGGTREKQFLEIIKNIK